MRPAQRSSCDPCKLFLDQAVNVYCLKTKTTKSPKRPSSEKVEDDGVTLPKVPLEVFLFDDESHDTRHEELVHDGEEHKEDNH